MEAQIIHATTELANTLTPSDLEAIKLLLKEVQSTQASWWSPIISSLIGGGLALVGAFGLEAFRRNREQKERKAAESLADCKHFLSLAMKAHHNIINYYYGMVDSYTMKDSLDSLIDGTTRFFFLGPKEFDKKANELYIIIKDYHRLINVYVEKHGPTKIFTKFPPGHKQYMKKIGTILEEFQKIVRCHHKNFVQDEPNRRTIDSLLQWFQKLFRRRHKNPAQH
jgi:hypothetical protein